MAGATKYGILKNLTELLTDMESSMGHGLSVATRQNLTLPLGCSLMTEVGR